MRLSALGAAGMLAASGAPAQAQSDVPAGYPVASSAAFVPPGDMRDAASHELVTRHLSLQRRIGKVRGEPLGDAERELARAELASRTMRRLRVSLSRRERVLDRAKARSEAAARARKRRAQRASAPSPALQAIAQCESHGDPRAISPGGAYRGKYQFSLSTWASVGGSGDPAAASEREQDRRAATLLRTGGPGHWPVCGR